MRIPVFLLITIFYLVNTCLAQAPIQNRSDLEKERASIQKEIEYVKRSLDITHKNRKQTLGQLALLQKRLRLRELTIVNINKQLSFIQADMNSSWSEIIKLKKELDTLRKQYAESVIYAYENRTNYDFLNFIFAASNFNDAVKRFEYLKSYRTYREQRADNILKTQALLENKINGLKMKSLEKDEALLRQSREKQVLEVEKKEKDIAFEQLLSHEKELKREMNLKKRKDQKLGNAIAAAIRNARIEAKREAMKKKPSKISVSRNITTSGKKELTGNSSGTLREGNIPSKLNPAENPFKTRADIELSGNFEKYKGHLPWPIASGTIAIRFGPHVYLKGLTHDNQGITIESAAGSSIMAVFDGIVQSVFFVGDATVVMIRHGKYFTTYSNLSSASVSKGQSIKMGQLLGKLQEAGQFDFIISDEKDQHFDPELWLRK
jgi:septal ring factor EnvC (AmiA/AmiB activator)